jgi:hypothetical protein
MFHFHTLHSCCVRFGRCLASFLVVVSVQSPSIVLADEKRAYVPYSNIERGIEGVNEVSFAVRNDTAKPLHCLASLAHWYSAPIGDVAAGETLLANFWHNPKTGSLSMLNQLQDRMPIEAITCGPLPLDPATGAELSLNFRAGIYPTGFTYICIDTDDFRLVCRENEISKSH